MESRDNVSVFSSQNNSQQNEHFDDFDSSDISSIFDDREIESILSTIII